MVSSFFSSVCSLNSFNFSQFQSKYLEHFKDSHAVPSYEFLTWLVGFAEGDGSFVVTAKGYLQFVITQSANDVQVLDFIASSLGFGHVIKQGETTCRFIVQDKVGLSLILLLFNGNIVLPSKLNSFQAFVAAFNLLVTTGRILLDTVLFIDSVALPTLNDNWFAGFVDSESTTNPF
jgi:LAGLIDADG endonuclease